MWEPVDSVSLWWVIIAVLLCGSQVDIVWLPGYRYIRYYIVFNIWHLTCHLIRVRLLKYCILRYLFFFLNEWKISFKL